ncbi:TRAP transporter substrate-binding protein DctP [Lactonifactor longoviformis]|uniref:TRAP transporter substrate-binding protein DctP n=1 Tax=Lactonifactor longoviformis TaxID=341220 RepID=UPI0036F1EBD7
MKKMKKVAALVLGCIMMASLSACGGTESKDGASDSDAKDSKTETSAGGNVELTMASGATTEHILSKFGQALADAINEKTGGTVTVKYYPGDTLAEAGQRLEMNMNGDLDIDIQALSVYDSYNPQQGIMSAFFMFESWEHYRAVTESDTYTKIIEGLEGATGLTDLGDVYYAKRNFLSKTPIQSLSDMENMKFRTPNEEMPIAFIKALGAAPTPMSGNEVYTSLQNGTITATENGAEQIVNSAFYEVADNMTMTAHQYQTMHIMLSQTAKDKLSEEQLKAVQEAVNETVAEYDPLCQEQEATQEEFLRENIHVYDIDLTEFYDAAEKTYDDFDDVWGDGTWEKFKELAK